MPGLEGFETVGQGLPWSNGPENASGTPGIAFEPFEPDFTDFKSFWSLTQQIASISTTALGRSRQSPHMLTLWVRREDYSASLLFLDVNTSET